MKTIKDKVFGDMEYDDSWVKREKVTILKREINLCIVAECYSDQEILELQREAYIQYNNHFEEYSNKVPEVLLNYYKENFDMISEEFDIPEQLSLENVTEDLIVKLIGVTNLYIDREGQFGWLCDCAWEEEHGLCILLSGDEPSVEEYDYLL